MKQNLESLSPFELSLYLEKSVEAQKESKEWLNAGRGNPNWTAPIPREAFFLLGEFATRETHIANKDMLGTMVKESSGREERFEAFLETKESAGAKLLEQIWNKGQHLLGMPREKWLTDMLDHTIGDNYRTIKRESPRF
ncbi:hypothetical protein GCM10008932_10410 [Alkalibacterium iburiense]|uniref:Uncharacterized protein n=1 Tax=Alkalibacterium iburiense TaxID=290589 RepID=A0ABN0XB79_9LACT